MRGFCVLKKNKPFAKIAKGQKITPGKSVDFTLVDFLFLGRRNIILNRFDRNLLFCQSLQTARADFCPSAVNFFGLQIDKKPAFGGDI